MSERLHVLFVRGMLYYDGVSSVEYEWIKALKDRVAFDYVLLDPDKSVPEKEAAVKALGCGIYPLRYQSGSSLTSHRNREKVLRDFLTKHHYDVVHIDTDLLSRYDVAKVARQCGVKKVIIHSHNAMREVHGIQKLPGVAYLERRMIAKYATDLAACSKEAANWLFNPGDQGRVKIIHNGIDRERYVFKPEKRAATRQKLGIADDTLLLGNIGRLTEQKNQLYLLDILAATVKQRPKTKLLLIGSGEKAAEIQAKIKELKLADQVIMISSTDEIPDYLFAMDVFVMPSLYEGLPMTLLEAQTTGLPCVISENISSEMDFPGMIRRQAIAAAPEEWAKLLLATEPLADRAAEAETLTKIGYDNRESAEQVYQMYIGGR
ncbi:putative glycosyltransferase EpsF [Lactobacillus nasalidis]|uniref:Glycosyltransferase EpsF n=1 Tax=Lactobacillus nasalidis TaxID=2797258 RepID=A0ABQ3W5Z6_9LACO|nr:glycosyltransferase [Lactobacillus nasalidis]GHV98482.1 putative glycosyltransferase EpsF [Lactobacillus nasalidis]GHV98992.1 putative glycosyltransferase EpsF [Lactobacillus nasalidis]GHW00906.1 putative glycosyltransferase EpsF [Lactobacillus nasalidis]